MNKNNLRIIKDTVRILKHEKWDNAAKNLQVIVDDYESGAQKLDTLFCEVLQQDITTGRFDLTGTKTEYSYEIDNLPNGEFEMIVYYRPAGSKDEWKLLDIDQDYNDYIDRDDVDTDVDAMVEMGIKIKPTYIHDGA